MGDSIRINPIDGPIIFLTFTIDFPIAFPKHLNHRFSNRFSHLNYHRFTIDFTITFTITFTIDYPRFMSDLEGKFHCIFQDPLRDALQLRFVSSETATKRCRIQCRTVETWEKHGKTMGKIWENIGKIWLNAWRNGSSTTKIHVLFHMEKAINIINLRLSSKLVTSKHLVFTSEPSCVWGKHDSPCLDRCFDPRSRRCWRPYPSTRPDAGFQQLLGDPSRNDMWTSFRIRKCA